MPGTHTPGEVGGRKADGRVAHRDAAVVTDVVLPLNGMLLHTRYPDE